MNIKRREIAPLCQCGCGQRVTKHTQIDRWNKYIHGHSNKGTARLKSPPRLCACGCGKLANSEKKFIYGHHRIGATNSKEGNEKRSKALKGRKPTEEAIKNMKLGQQKAWDNEDRKREFSENNPSKRPEVIEKIRKCSLELWQDEEHRNKHLLTLNSLEYHEAHSGENAWNWQGGKSFEIYPKEWTNRLKKSIRKRDNHQCQVCNTHQNLLGKKLDVHHIDYNKKNCNPNNLISLCESCHMKTNFNRDKWTEFFRLKIANKINEILISYLPVYQISKGNENYRTGV